MGCYSSKHVRSASYYVGKYPSCKVLDQQPHILIDAIIDLVTHPSRCSVMKTYKYQNTWNSKWEQKFQFGIVHITIEIPIQENLEPHHLSVQLECNSSHIITGLRLLIESKLNTRLEELDPPWRKDTFVLDNVLTYTRTS